MTAHEDESPAASRPASQESSQSPRPALLFGYLLLLQAAIFAVSTALAGIWGMNFERMPELKWAYGYPMALGIIAAAGGLLYWRFRRAGWL